MEEQKLVIEEETFSSHSGIYRVRIACVTFALTLLGFLIVMKMSFMGSTFFGGIGATIAWMYGAEMLEPVVSAIEVGKKLKAQKSKAQGTAQLVRPKEEVPAPMTTTKFNDEENELGAYTKPVTPANFSQVLIAFTPSLTHIYLGTLIDGRDVYSDAKGLCHVALGGSTGLGKSTLERLLMAQLCAAGVSVLLLNPHYTRYDIEHNEDWTPFEPYLLHPPMECRQYEAIEFYLKQVATVLLPKRLDKYAYSQPVGKPYFLVIDELPAIIKKVPGTSEYLEAILREGRKVGIFLVTAATDFLVKTVAPQGGGAIRDCYRTAFYVGGDPTTARILLDVPSSQVQEHLLGKGTVMLRSQNCKQASLARVPYVDNQALYDLLGPSTYVPGEEGTDDQDELILEHLSPSRLDTSVLASSLLVKTRSEPVTKVLTQARVSGRVMPKLTPELQMVLDVYTPGMSHRMLEHELFKHGQKVSHVTAGRHLQRLKDLRIIDADGNLLVNR